MLKQFQKKFVISFLILFSLPVSCSQLSERSAEREDAFSWQNEMHYKETIAKFSALAEKEYHALLETLLTYLDSSPAFMIERHEILISHIQRTIYNWIIEDMTSLNRYLSQPDNENDYYYPSDSDGDESDEDAWRSAMIRGYYKDGSESEEEPQSFEDDIVPMSFSEDNVEQEEFERWQLTQIHDVLGMSLDSMDDFTQYAIPMPAIKRFLLHVEDGHSWLINEMVGGSLGTAHDISSHLQETIDIDKELPLEIFEGLWFDYDWERFDIADPLFIAKTYKAALLDVKAGKRAKSIKKYVLETITRLFSFNKNHFSNSLAQLTQNYNRSVAERNWLRALVEWSVYCAYRKMFAAPSARKRKLHNYETVTPAMPVFRKINADLESDINEKRDRALMYYTKVYLKPTTTKLVYTDNQGRKGEFALASKLSKLKRIGMSYEPYRPRKSENVLKPQLYFIIQDLNLDEAPRFTKVPLLAESFGLEHRPLTRAENDNVFEDPSDDYYFKQVRNDYVYGQLLQGETKQSARSLINEKIENETGRDRELVHSERVIMELLRKRDSATIIVNRLAAKLQPGTYFIHGVVMLAYSTNSVCPNCTPTLIALMNSHEQGGFLNNLVRELDTFDGEVQFMTPVSPVDTEPTDWTKLRMNIFVTARIDFDPQAHDLTEVGQHEYTTFKDKVPSASNPQTQLIRPDSEFELSEVPLLANKNSDKHQRFFYEFVGRDIHTEQLPFNDTASLIFSSGSKQWNKRY